MKLFTMTLLLATVFVGFNACSSDAKEEDIDNGGAKKLTKVVNEYVDNTRTETFAYSNGKLSKHVSFYSDRDDKENDLTITYNGNTVTMKGELDDHKSELTYTLTNGLATSCKRIDLGDGEETNYTFKYSDGYLTELLIQHPNREIQLFNYTYTNGNIEKATQRYGYENYTNETKYTIVYSDKVNKGGIINPLLHYDLFEFGHIAAFYAGILGKSTKHLAVFYEEKDDTSTSSYTDNCVFALDNEGYVKTATLSDEKYTYTFE